MAYYLLTPGSNFFYKRGRELELYINTLNAFVFAMDLLQKQVLEFKETKAFTVNQAMLLRIKNDCEAFVESLQAIPKPSADVLVLSKKLTLVINSLSSLIVRTAGNESISWWDLISDFRAPSIESRLSSHRSGEYFSTANREGLHRAQFHPSKLTSNCSRLCCRRLRPDCSNTTPI
jgi:hypothetical protein